MCGKEIKRSPSQMRHKHYFCSVKCKNDYYFHNWKELSFKHTWVFAHIRIKGDKDER